MNIIVCVKPVPDPEKYNLLTIDPNTKRLVREGIPTIINPADRNALETALNLKEKYGGEIAVLSMSPLFSSDKITECLAMGADKAFIVSDAAFGGADTYATSYTLAKAIDKMKETTGFSPDLILGGNDSADGATSQVIPQLGEWMRLPHVSNVMEVSVSRDPETHLDSVTLKKKTAEGFLEYEVGLPAVLSIARGSNKPRLVSAIGIVKARNKKIEVFTKNDLETEENKIGLAGSPTKPGALISPDMSRKARGLTGEPDEIAGQILDIVRKAGVDCLKG